MEPPFDFSSYLKELLEQIPEGDYTTFFQLAQGLGDPISIKAIRKTLTEPTFRDSKQKVIEKHRGEKIFKEFKTTKPLKKLRIIQKELSKKVVDRDVFDSIEFIAAVDVAYRRNEAYSVCIVMNKELTIIDKGNARVEIDFPYIPGYFGWREGPAIKAAVEKVKQFDVLIVGAHGISHPRGFGLASQIGLEVNKPTIGVAKRLLVGDLGKPEEDYCPVNYKRKVVAIKLYRGGFSPIYISVGHQISLRTATGLIRKLWKNRLPEPLLNAHNMAVVFRNSL